jgi:uncharacterized Ntn-hydrolase superfamily protein
MRPSTYSIVASDPEHSELGVAVQSKFLAVGSLVPWAEAEIGAVATQAWMNPAFGPDGLALLRDGLDAEAALDRLVARDPGRERRQVGIVDANGNAATYTGSGCLDWAGSRTGEGYAVQGNLLVSNATVDAIASAFEEASSSSLAERLLAALAAGQAAGGDRRGQQAAALLVVAKGRGYGGCDIVVDLRIDDHQQPVDELARLLALHELYFGQTPEEAWLTVNDELAAELRNALTRLGYATGDLAGDLDEWAGYVNLEERVKGADRIDPVVLGELRRAAAS